MCPHTGEETKVARATGELLYFIVIEKLAEKFGQEWDHGAYLKRHFRFESEDNNSLAATPGDGSAFENEFENGGAGVVRLPSMVSTTTTRTDGGMKLSSVDSDTEEAQEVLEDNNSNNLSPEFIIKSNFHQELDEIVQYVQE